MKANQKNAQIQTDGIWKGKNQVVPPIRTLAAAFGVGAIFALCFLTLQGEFTEAQSSHSAEPDLVVLALDPTPTATTQVREANVATPTPTVLRTARTTYITPVPTSVSVSDALGDDEVTLEEYTQAVNNTMACLDEKGIVHTNPVYDESRVQYTYSVTNPVGAGPQDVSVYDECWMRYERDVQAKWVQQNGSRRTFEVINEKGALQCAFDHGLDAKTFDDIVALKRENPQDPAIQHCFIIGTNGFDPSLPQDDHS